MVPDTVKLGYIFMELKRIKRMGGLDERTADFFV
jgi:hypothetical protein